MCQPKGKLFSKRQAFWSLLIILTLVQACGKDHPASNDQPDDPPPTSTKPAIISFTPARGVPGTEVTITGKNFKANVLQNYALFSGAALEAFITNATTTELKVKVPDDAVTGKIIVKVGNESDTSATDFIVDPAVTSITDFTPKQGPFGTQVTLTGTRFGNDIKVKINDIEATVNQHSATRIVFTIPVNTSLTAHKITVISGTAVLQTADNFTVTGGPYAHWENKNTGFFPEGIPAFWAGLSFVHNNKIYWGFTGLSATDDQADYMIYDPAQHGLGWQAMFPPPAKMAHGKLQFATAIVYNDRVFTGTGLNAVGGTGTSTSNLWFEFQPPASVSQTGTATRLTDFPHTVSGALSFVMNGRAYVGFGGTNKKLYRFDPAGNNNLGSWVPATNMDAPFSELNTGNAVVLNNEAYFGRAVPAPLQTRNAFYKFSQPDPGVAGQVTRVTDMPDDFSTFSTPAFHIGNKGYFVVNKKVWEYTPDGNGGTWRAVVSQDTAPDIQFVAVLTVNGSRVVYGWTGSGSLYEFKL